MESKWAQAEMKGAVVWDPRCRKSLAAMVERLTQHPEASFSHACGPAARQAAQLLADLRTTKARGGQCQLASFQVSDSVGHALDALRAHAGITDLDCQGMEECDKGPEVLELGPCCPHFDQLRR